MELSATEKVLASLRKDKKRVTKNISATRKRAFASSAESDTDSGDENVLRQRARCKLKTAVRSVITFIKSQPRENGVSLKDMADRYRFRFEGHPLELSGEESKFVLDVLRADPLMFKTTAAIIKVQRSLELHWVAEKDDDRSVRVAGLDSAVEALYKIKLFTARHLWQKEVEPLREKYSTLQRLHENLKIRFNDTRTDYLREISEFRDAKGRTLPHEVAKIDDAGIKLFFDPVTSLSDEELSFLTKAVSEKLKMIFDHDPNVQVNPAQIQAMLGKQEGNEVSKLKEIIEQRDAELKELKAKVRRLEMGLPAAAPAANAGSGQPGANNKMIKVLEDQIEDLRDKIKEDQSAAKRLSVLELEHEDLQRAYDGEVEERLRVQARLELADNKLQEVEQGKAEAKKTLEAKLEAIELEKKELTSQVSRQQKALDVASKRRSVRAKTRKATLDASKFDSGCQRMRQLAEETFANGDHPEMFTRSPKGGLGIVGTAASSCQREDLPDTYDEEGADDVLDALDLEEERDNQLLTAVKDVERTNKRLTTECASLKAENCRLNDEVQVQKEALGSLRKSQAKQFADSALEDVRQLRMMAFDSNPPSPVAPSRREEVLSQSLPPAAQLDLVEKLAHEAKFLQEKAASVSEDLELSLQEAGANWEEDAEKAATIHNLRRQARELKFQTFSHEAQLEAARSNLEIANGRSPMLSGGGPLMQVLQDMQGNLMSKLEDSANANMVMVNWVNDTQQKSKDIIQKLRDSAKRLHSKQSDEDLQASLLMDLEGVVSEDAFAGGKPSFTALVERLHSGYVLTERQLAQRQKITEESRMRNEATAKLDTTSSKAEGRSQLPERQPTAFTDGSRSKSRLEDDQPELQRPWSCSPSPEISPPAGKRASLPSATGGVSRTEQARRAARMARKDAEAEKAADLQELRPMAVQMQRAGTDSQVPSTSRASQAPTKLSDPAVDDLVTLPPVVSPASDRRHSVGSPAASRPSSRESPEKLKKRANSLKSGPDMNLTLSGGGLTRQVSVS